MQPQNDPETFLSSFFRRSFAIFLAMKEASILHLLYEKEKCSEIFSELPAKNAAYYININRQLDNK